MVEDFGGGGEGIKAYDIAVKILWRPQERYYGIRTENIQVIDKARTRFCAESTNLDRILDSANITQVLMIPVK